MPYFTYFCNDCNIEITDLYSNDKPPKCSECKKKMQRIFDNAPSLLNMDKYGRSK